MKLYGTIAVHVQVTEILRAPRFFEKLSRAFGGDPDLRTGRVRSAIEATALVEAVRDALRKLGATNAISLIVDGTVLFHDRNDTPDDLGDLFLAFSDNESVFGTGFEELRLAVEHREAGVHHVIEIQARPEHASGAPAIRIIASGRIEALSPRPGEDAEAYRRRAEPVAGDARALELYRLQFEAFVDRLRDAIAAAMPTARVEVERAEPRIVRPEAGEAAAARGESPQAPQPQPLPPTAAYYDPYAYYYPSPLDRVADALLWSSLFSMAMPPHYVVVDHTNLVQGFADDPGIEAGATRVLDDAGGNWWDGSDSGNDAAALEAAGDASAADDGASDPAEWSDDPGTDLDDNRALDGFIGGDADGYADDGGGFGGFGDDD
jgi:hypothetical protein